MDYFKNFDSEYDKLLDLLAEWSLVAAWHKQRYPIRLIISPNASPESQMTLLEDEGRAMSQDAKLIYTFHLSGTTVSTAGKINLPNDTMAKIKSAADKLYKHYTAAFFAMVNDNGEKEEDAPEAPEEVEDGDNTEVDNINPDVDNADAPPDTETPAEKNNFDGFYDKEPSPAE